MRYDLDGGSGLGPERRVIKGALFGGAIDFGNQGGLVVLDNSQIAEVMPLKFVPEGADTSLHGSRVKRLPFLLNNGQVEYCPDDEYDPQKPTIGVEPEMYVTDDSGSPYALAPDGFTIEYPNGDKEPAEYQGHVPEILAYTHECGTDAPYPRGYKEFRENTDRLIDEKNEWLESRGLISPPISGYPGIIGPEDISAHPIFDMFKKPDVLPRSLEYAFCMSEQINIQMKDPEAALFAINVYQLLQPVLNVVTADSAVRDGSLATTMRDHYVDNPGFEASTHRQNYRDLADRVKAEMPGLPFDLEGDDKTDFYDQIPYDWRPIARSNGSVSGGIINKGTPLSIEGFLAEGDRQLRANETMTSARTLGWHTDRLRIDKGVVELCNPSHAGGHPEKVAAVQETMVKVIISLQNYFSDPSEYKESWRGVIPNLAESDNPENRQNLVDVAHVNNVLAAYYGKDRKFLDTNWEEKTQREIYEIFCDFIETYSTEPISEEAKEEIGATLESAPENIYESSSADEVLKYFYSSGSKMTAVEAIRLAAVVEEDLDVQRLLTKMTNHAKIARKRKINQKTVELTARV